MRLWHQNLIEKLPNSQLKDQHRECCGLRGNGWNVKHKTVNYVFKYHWYILYLYHMRIIEEINKRNEKGLMSYKIDKLWYLSTYRGKHCKRYNDIDLEFLMEWLVDKDLNHKLYKNNGIYYKEHNINYYEECMDNLENKGVILND